MLILQLSKPLLVENNYYIIRVTIWTKENSND